MELETKKKLNIGCGVDSRAGWVNLDVKALPGVDIVHDLEDLPLPFPEEEFDEILCQDVLEHIEYIPLLRELHRILKREGIITIRVPHFTSRNNFVDPTHRRLFSVDTWEFFVTNGSSHMRHLQPVRSYYFDFAFRAIEARHLTFETVGRAFFLNRLVERIVNGSPRRQSLYESMFWSRLFPAENVCVRLRK
jgi:ubiquinone/menaquinone biosynthesis C-methylase UbiE